jgi:hypothetical protein
VSENILPGCENNATYSTICVTFIPVKIVNFVLSKTIRKMKEKEKFSNPSVRHNSIEDKEIHHGYLLYSAGEDYYDIYQEEKDVEQDDSSGISGIINIGIFQ